jgi:hypothetical protein
MAHTNTELVIFTGAGASKPLNYPTSTEFFASDMQAWLPIANYLRTGNQLDVEDVLGMLEEADAFFMGRVGGLVNAIINVPAQQVFTHVRTLVKSIKDKCFQVYGRLPDPQAVKGLYLPLFDRLKVKDRVTDFFTTNYDPVSEEILLLVEEQYRISRTQGFNEHGLWSPTLFDLGQHFRLFRMHGSMCYLRQGQRIRHTHQYEQGTVLQNHLLLFPGYKGNQSEAEEIYKIPHLKFGESMATASFAVFIGYSFRDKYINEEIVRAKKANRAMRIAIINTENPQNIAKNFPESANDAMVSYLPVPFGDQRALDALATVPGLG